MVDQTNCFLPELATPEFEKSVFLKSSSWGDSMEAFPDSFYHGGGFGVWGDGVAYYVDSSGTIQENP